MYSKETIDFVRKLHSERDALCAELAGKIAGQIVEFYRDCDGFMTLDISTGEILRAGSQELAVIRFIFSCLQDFMRLPDADELIAENDHGA